jgi:hypothetical protein
MDTQSQMNNENPIPQTDMQWENKFDFEYSRRDLNNGYLSTALREEIKSWIKNNVLLPHTDQSKDWKEALESAATAHSFQGADKDYDSFYTGALWAKQFLSTPESRESEAGKGEAIAGILMDYDNSTIASHMYHDWEGYIKLHNSLLASLYDKHITCKPTQP